MQQFEAPNEQVLMPAKIDRRPPSAPSLGSLAAVKGRPDHPDNDGGLYHLSYKFSLLACPYRQMVRLPWEKRVIQCGITHALSGGEERARCSSAAHPVRRDEAPHR